MNLFIITFHKAITPEIENEVNSDPLVKQAFKLNDHDMLVQSYADSPQALSESIGMIGEPDEARAGVVFNLEGSYHGYYHKDLWNWLEAVRV